MAVESYLLATYSAQKIMFTMNQKFWYLTLRVGNDNFLEFICCEKKRVQNLKFLVIKNHYKLMKMP